MVIVNGEPPQNRSPVFPDTAGRSSSSEEDWCQFEKSWMRPPSIAWVHQALFPHFAPDLKTLVAEALLPLISYARALSRGQVPALNKERKSRFKRQTLRELNSWRAWNRYFRALINSFLRSQRGRQDFDNAEVIPVARGGAVAKLYGGATVGGWAIGCLHPEGIANRAQTLMQETLTSGNRPGDSVVVIGTDSQDERVILSGCQAGAWRSA